MDKKGEVFMAVLLLLGLIIYMIFQVSNERTIDAPQGSYYGTEHGSIYMP